MAQAKLFNVGISLLVSYLCSIPMQTHCTLRKLMLVKQASPYG